MTAPDALAGDLLDLNSAATRRVCRRLILIVLLIGVGCRIAQYAARLSYWNDEAAVVINVMHRDCRQLLEPLDYAQAAPPLFLWIERGMLRAFGPGELSMRLPPVLLGLLSLPLFAMLAWHLLPPTSAFWAAAFFAISDKLVPHVSDVKQYSGDVFISVFLLFVTLGWKTPRTSSLIRLAAASAVAVVGVWFSFPAIFLFGAISLMLLPACLRRGTIGWAAYFACNLTVAASFLGLYVAVLRKNHDPSLLEFWQNSFPTLRHFPAWLATQLYGVVGYPFVSLEPISAFLAVIGIVALIKARRQRLLAIAGLTLALALIAAALRRYPFPGDHRLSLYLLPLLLLILAAGAEGQNLRLPAGICRWWWIVPASLLGLSIAQVCNHAIFPDESSTMRDVVAHVRSHRMPQEPIYLVGDALREQRPSGRNIEFLCYWPDPPGQVIIGFRPPSQISARRFWVVYSLRRPDTAVPKFADDLQAAYGSSRRLAGSWQSRKQSGAMLFETQ